MPHRNISRWGVFMGAATIVYFLLSLPMSYLAHYSRSYDNTEQLK